MGDEDREKKASDETALWNTAAVGELLQKLGYQPSPKKSEPAPKENKSMLPGLDHGVALAKDINRTSGATGVFAFVLLVILCAVGWKIMDDFEDAVDKLATHQAAMMKMLEEQRREHDALAGDVSLLFDPSERRRSTYRSSRFEDHRDGNGH